MIWFSIKELEKQLTTSGISDKTGFNYLLAHLILLTLFTPIGMDETATWIILAELAINLVAVVWGVKKTYEINQKGGNRDYFKRFISLSFVASIRLIVIIFAATFIITIAMEVAEAAGVSYSLNSFQQGLLDLGVLIAVIAFYLYMFLSSFSRINAQDRIRSEVELA